MNAVFAGWFAGYVMGVLTTVCLAIVVARMRDTGFVERWAARDVPGVMLAVPLFTGAALGWGMVGLLLGSLYEVGGFEEKPGALGAPSWVFLLLVGALAWLPLPILVLVWRRYWWMWAGLAASFVALFGWAMPLLAER
jgi:hypothetical protein